MNDFEKGDLKRMLWIAAAFGAVVIVMIMLFVY